MPASCLAMQWYLEATAACLLALASAGLAAHPPPGCRQSAVSSCELMQRCRMKQLSQPCGKGVYVYFST